MNICLRIISRASLRPSCLPAQSRRLPQVAARTTRLAIRSANTVRCPRFLSMSTPARAAVVMNPRKDEHGSLMTIDISQRAAQRLKEIQMKDSNPNLALRITVESGGCHGFKYTISLSDIFDKEEDTVFEEDGAKVVMDEPSLGLLKGSKIDYTMELIGSQFKIVDNPHATSSCGCGTSFDIESF